MGYEYTPTGFDMAIRRAADMVRSSRAKLPQHLKDMPIPPRPDHECEELILLPGLIDGVE